mmetsp:Transcript_16002/g.28723  ORF Transcript_16002/g.28723 Transcript_16002/m.28723 type:complete len:237 (+) Transcript_16002:178-888(+)
MRASSSGWQWLPVVLLQLHWTAIGFSRSQASVGSSRGLRAPTLRLATPVQSSHAAPSSSQRRADLGFPLVRSGSGRRTRVANSGFEPPPVSSRRPGNIQVWTGRHPLIGGPPFFLLHQAVWILDSDTGQCTMHDFVPKKTAFADVLPMLLAQRVSGRLRRVPAEKISSITTGSESMETYTCPPPSGALQCNVAVSDSAEVDMIVRGVNEGFDSSIALLANDCSTYVDLVVKALCGR